MSDESSKVINFELFESFKLFKWLMRKINYCKSIKNTNYLDTTKGQGRIIAILLMEDSLNTKELASRVGINVSSINELLSKMEERGLINRIPSKEDKRVIINSLTSKAKEYRLNFSFRIFDCLNTSEKQILIKIMDKLNNYLANKIMSFGSSSFKIKYNERKRAICKLQELNKNKIKGK